MLPEMLAQVWVSHVGPKFRLLQLGFQPAMGAPARSVGIQLDVVPGREPSDVKWTVINLVHSKYPVFPPVGGQGHIKHIIPDTTGQVVEQYQPFALHGQ